LNLFRDPRCVAERANPDQACEGTLVGIPLHSGQAAARHHPRQLRPGRGETGVNDELL